MTQLDPGLRLHIHRSDLTRTQFGPDPDAPAARPLAAGQARLTVDHFALTANNITYAAFGQAMKYWQFFPAADAAWGCLPVWGFATVSESSAEGVAVGRRVWGYFPAGSHLVVEPSRVSAQGFADGAAHRQDLAAVYNHYGFCDADPTWRPEHEALQALLRPLFTTAFLLDDFLAGQDFFGATQLLLSSASSKTAYGTAFCLAQRRRVSPDADGQAGSSTGAAPRVLGLTSPGHVDFARTLGCYDAVHTYGELATLDATQATVYVDFAGDAALRRAVHQHFDGQLRHSSSIGGTHWDALGSGAGLPGPRPTLFFAPAQMKLRAAPPPEGWGRDGLERRIAQATRAFMAQVQQADTPWLQVVQHSGQAAVEASYQALLAGTANARQGQMLSLTRQGSHMAG